MKNTGTMLIVITAILLVIAAELLVLITKMPATAGEVRRATHMGANWDYRTLDRVLAVEVIE